MRKFKKNLLCLYFFAYWDDCEQFKIRFAKICRFHNVRYNFVDCETPSGVAESIRRGVKLCPTVIVLENGEEVYRCKGNNAYNELDALFSQLPTSKGMSL